MYEPTLVEVPLRRSLEDYRLAKVPVLDQGEEGACTGFGLATVVHYLLRTRKVVPDAQPVSPRMLYEMARRYDEWSGEDYAGSSARGAMKGWHKHGVCGEEAWPYDAATADRAFTSRRARDALRRPLGAYLRVNHRDIVALHAALTETGILYATAAVHAGWDRVGRNGIVLRNDPQSGEPHTLVGGHAFAIVAYDEHGLWIQNSWGGSWGLKGCGRISYDDWLENGTDVWVARLGVPIELAEAKSGATLHGPGGRGSRAYVSADLRPHIVSLGNDGRLFDKGAYGTNADEVREIFDSDFPRLTANWPKKRLLLYAHGGLVGEDEAAARIASYRPAMLANHIYPVGFIWRTDFWSTVKNILEDALRQRRPEGVLEAAKDFMLDRLDDALEAIARVGGGKALWEEVKENALLATRRTDGGARFAAECIRRLCAADPTVEIHAVAHSAGGIFQAPLVQLLSSGGPIAVGPLKGETGFGLKVRTCTLWAPACRVDLFKETYLPGIASGGIGRFAVFTLTDRKELDDNCKHIYNKSLLYLVSNAGEEPHRIPLVRPDGGPLLGMQKYIEKDDEVRQLFAAGRADWVLAPNNEAAGTAGASRATAHDAFDDDTATVTATLTRILGQAPIEGPVKLGRTATAAREIRQRLA
ncbi:MAG: C1 family peptidase [Rhodocyclales bacterium]|nr:C1 family peptidase [Rhodocyclales bacterium]